MTRPSSLVLLKASFALAASKYPNISAIETWVSTSINDPTALRRKCRNSFRRMSALSLGNVTRDRNRSTSQLRYKSEQFVPWQQRSEFIDDDYKQHGLLPCDEIAEVPGTRTSEAVPSTTSEAILSVIRRL